MRRMERVSELASERASEGESVPSRVHSFRDLVAWQRAKEVAKRTYVLTKQMPHDERFGLMSQMRRAAISVPSNIAEGFGRESRADYLKFLRIARGSLAELATQYEIATELNLIPPEPDLEAMIAETARVLGGLIRALERAPSRKPGANK